MQRQNVVRRLRKAARLAQHELATLLDTSQAAVSRIEAGGDTPEGDCLISMLVLFDTTVDQLFPERFGHITEEVVRRAAELDRRLLTQRSRASLRKRVWLRTIINRANVTPA